jgi:hypothetical protein
MPDYTPVNNVDTITMTAGAVITGGQLLSVSASNTVVPSTTGDHSVGVALSDCPSGGRVSMALISGAVHELAIQGAVAIAAGVPVIAGTAGTINTAALATAAGAGTLLGICTVAGTGGVGTGKARFIGV